MQTGNVDIDIEDTKLADEIGDIQYHFKNARGSLQVAKKEAIRERRRKVRSGKGDETGGSPDHADAFIYATAPLGFDIYDPVQALAPGTEFALDVEELLWDMDTAIGVI